MILEESYTLSNGVHIPKLGLGTWFIPDESTAQAHGNEHIRDYGEFGIFPVYGGRM